VLGELGRQAWELLDLYHRISSHIRNDLDIESRAVELAFSIVKFSAREPRDLRSLQRAREYIHAHFADNLTLAQVARATGVHPVYLARQFRLRYHCTIGEYLRQLRIETACREISEAQTPLSVIAANAGFYDQSHFANTFKRYTGMTPTQYRAITRSARTRQNL